MAINQSINAVQFLPCTYINFQTMGHPTQYICVQACT